jgi:hypothetical protein
MALGRAARAAGAPALQYVTLLPSERGYYSVPLQGWRVGDKALQVNAVGLARARRTWRVLCRPAPFWGFLDACLRDAVGLPLP